MERLFYTNHPLRTIATSNTIQNLSPKTKRCSSINSPMTNLTLNLSELSTGRVTPRRKLSLSNIETPDPSVCHVTERSISTESGCFLDSPSPVDSPTLEMSSNCFGAQSNSETGTLNIRRKSIALRRINSMPVPRMMLSPDDVMTGNHSTPHGNDMIESATLNMSIDTIDGSESGTSETSSTSDFHTSGSSDGSSGKSAQEKRATFFIEESCSQDSGLGFERADSTDSCKDSNDGFTFAAPMGLPLRLQAKMISEDTCSPFKYSPVKLSPAHRRNSCPVSSLDFSGEFTKSSSSEGGEDSPLKICRLTSVDEGHGGDDGFLDVMDAEVAALTNGSGLSSAMSSLFNAPVLNKRSVTTTQEDDDTPVTRRSMCRRNIARSMSMDVRPQRISFKRENPDCGDSPMQISFKRPQDESTPIQQQKRHRPASVIESPMQARVRPSLHRCHSETEAMIKSALARQADEPDLVGDCSRSYALPTVRGGKHQNLKSISRETLSHVLDGHYASEIEQAIIVDCRYPYEFDGGHIEGAKNLYTTEHIISEFLKKPITAKDPSKRVVVVFHCEFSSERGPKMYKFLREQDRQLNKECYPSLHYPEIYLLDQGYKAYFETEKHHCEPQTYKPMLHKDHAEDLRKFRSKSKSWAGEQRASRSGFRPLKF